MEWMKTIDRYDPITEAEKFWLDKASVYSHKRYQKVDAWQSEAEQPAPVKHEDKLEQTKPAEEYKPQRALLTSETEKALDAQREEYLQDERRAQQATPWYKPMRAMPLGHYLDETA
jgi:hypothetical protein